MISNRPRNAEEIQEGVEYLCKVFVDEEEIVNVDGGLSREEVKTRAADRAVKILRVKMDLGKGGSDGGGDGDEMLVD